MCFVNRILIELKHSLSFHVPHHSHSLVPVRPLFLANDCGFAGVYAFLCTCLCVYVRARPLDSNAFATLAEPLLSGECN